MRAGYELGPNTFGPPPGFLAAMPRDRSGERAHRVPSGLCKEALAFKQLHDAGKVAAKQLRVVNELKRTQKSL